MRKLIFALLGMLVIQGVTGQQVNEIHFENGSWLPQQLSNVEDWTMGQDDLFDDKWMRLIQFDQIPSVEVISQLYDLGIELMEYYPDNSYLAQVKKGATIYLSPYGVTGIAVLPWETKVTKDILRGDIGDWAIQGRQVSVVIMYPEGTAPEIMENACAHAGVKVDQIFPDYSLIKAQVLLDDLYSLAKAPFVRYISIESEPGEPEDVEGRSLHRSNTINTEWSGGLKYDGTGVGVQVRDDGVLGPHIDFHGRLELNAYGEINTDHMDMVAGIFTGAGNVDPRVEGMASGATIYATNYQADFLDNTLDLHKEEGVLVTNSSYSNGCNAGYTQITWTVDRQISENPSLLHVFSAGNSNNNTCGRSTYGAGSQWGNITGGHKVAKNVIATANLRIDAVLETSSSRGPASDGRLKPDLAARGTEQMSADPNHAYGPGGGTSAASPGVAGVCAQLFEAYRDINNGETPESGLIKASLMNTANDLGNPGPDFRFGFGHINAGRAYQLLKDKRYLKGEVDQGEVKVHNFEIDADVKQLRFMLYWKEPQGSVGGAKALVNDLDLRVFHNGMTSMPLVLDPTPEADSLNKIAVPGNDDLNNVEQVVFDEVDGGTYEVRVNGTVLPFGAREYYVLVEAIDEEVVLTYPNGGEPFEPGTTEQLHWDAAPGTADFQLDYSADGGLSWDRIGQAAATTRMYDWTIPEDFTAEGVIRVSRNNYSSQNEQFFSVAPVSSQLRIERVCPEFVELSWSAVEDEGEYEVYMLGDKYMEVVARVDTAFAQIPVDDVLAEHWFSVRSITSGGAIGRRMTAIRLQNGLSNCSFTSDIELIEILQPNPYLVYSCGDFDEAVEVEVRNNGVNAVSEITVEYNVGQGILNAETFNVNLAPGAKTSIKFSDVLDLDNSGLYDLVVSASTSDDELPGNNTLTQSFELNNLEGAGASTPLTEGFEGAVFPPEDWTITGTFEGIRWEEARVLGPNGINTNVISLSSFNRSEINSFDEFYTAPIDLTGLNSPALKFDYSSAIAEGSNFNGRISVVVYSFCEDRTVETIYSSSLEDFNTALFEEYPYEPGSRNDWDEVVLDLSPFANSNVVIGWIVDNDFEFNTYIDNINIDESNVVFPNVNMKVSNTTPCRLFDVVEFEIENPTSGVEYSWNFGERASPMSASGPGPHAIRFLDSGEFEITVSGKDETSNVVVQNKVKITAYQRPSPVFTWEANGLTVEFTNLSKSADTYLWHFGDGNTSTETNPVHVYQSMGEYQVALTASNACDSRARTTPVQAGTVSAEDIRLQNVGVYPNPTAHELILDFGQIGLEGEWTILSLSGKIMRNGQLDQSAQQKLDLSGLSDGTYMIQLRTDIGQRSYRIVKMK